MLVAAGTVRAFGKRREGAGVSDDVVVRAGGADREAGVARLRDSARVEGHLLGRAHGSAEPHARARQAEAGKRKRA